MFVAFWPRAARCGLASACAFGLLGLSGSVSDISAADSSWPSRVTAAYNISFNGFDIGRFSFEAQVRSGRYTLDGSAEISALLGAVKWQGLTRTSGSIVGGAAHPAAYNFDFRSSAKSGSVKLAFRADKVTSIASSPPTPPTPDLVPLERRHLSDVLDPLSAVMAMTRPNTGNPCQQRLPVFDGKQRFDLVLTSLGERPLVERHPSGQPGLVHVCQMRYVPLAGYRQGKETDELARNMKIEVALRPVPGANLYVPHQITIPTMVGSVVLSLDRIDILTSNSDQIAFAN